MFGRKSLRKRKGMSYVLVILVFVVISSITVLLLSNVDQSVFQTHTYGMQMQSYYLNKQAADATVGVLLADDNELLKKMVYPRSDVLVHTDEDGNTIGKSTIVLTKEKHDYYGEKKDWIVARIETVMPDKRGSREGQDFTYQGSVMILLENPLIQLYNINPNTMP